MCVLHTVGNAVVQEIKLDKTKTEQNFDILSFYNERLTMASARGISTLERTVHRPECLISPICSLSLTVKYHCNDVAIALQIQ